jgi:photosystem II stability/assembly factor-like uncharacterized protein
MGSRRGGAVADAVLRGALVCAAAAAVGCPPPPPPTFSLTEFQPADSGRGGRTVAVSISARDPQIAIAASESGGLFRTIDGGATWSHVDTFPPFRMSDVAFARPGFGNLQVVVATATADATTDPQANQGGVWASSDEGATWTHVAPPAVCGTGGLNGFGIEYLAPSTIYVATGCGVLKNTVVGTTASWTQQSNWSFIYPAPSLSVIAQSNGGAITIDVCLQGDGHDRSTSGGATWRGVNYSVRCESPHSIASSPLEPNVLLGIGGTSVLESDDGGLTWPIDLHTGSWSTRPKFVVTHWAADQNPDHFDLYYSGRVVTCAKPPAGSNAQRCPTDSTTSPWPFIPSTSLNHDVNGVAISPGPDNCAVYEPFDFGVLKRGPAVAGAPCGSLAALTIAGQSGAGFGAFQIYSLTGQVTLPHIGRVPTNGNTALAFGTMDNMMYAIQDADTLGWHGFGIEGGFTQMLADSSLATTFADRALTYADFGLGEGMKLLPPVGTGAWGTEQAFTAATPPGNAAAPFLVAPGTYVRWSGTTLYLTADNGGTWTPVGTVPAGYITRNGMQVANVVQSNVTGPALFEVVMDSNGQQGVALLTGFIPPPSTPKAFTMVNFGGYNYRGLPSGLGGIASHRFGQWDWYGVSVLAADPNDYRNLYAVDSSRQMVVVSHDAGQLWKPDFNLYNLVVAGGVPMTDSIGGSQIHLFAYDRNNSSHILVGTDHAGIFASANGGKSWSALPGTNKATVMTSFFFDNRTDMVYLATYGRGLWKLTLDWTTVH